MEERGIFTRIFRKAHGSVFSINQEPVSPVGTNFDKKGRPMQSGREQKKASGFRRDKIFYDRTTHK